MMRARGAPARTASSRAMSPSPPSLTLRSGRPALRAASARIASGVSSDRVNAVTSGPGSGSPASCQTRRPLRLASRSQSAQSTALRAAPGGSRSRNTRRSSASGRPAIAAATLSGVSP